MKETSVSPSQWCLCQTLVFGAGDAGERWKGMRRDSHMPNQGGRVRIGTWGCLI